MPACNSTSLISSAMDKNEAEGPSSSSGLGGMGLMVLDCSCGKGRGVGETPAADIHDPVDLFDIAYIESRGLVSVLRDGWSVVERPEMMIEPLRLSNV